MFKRFSQSLIEKSASRAYSQRIQKKGATPEGVFWASELTQIARFDHTLKQLVDHIGTSQFSLADIGCGYGGLYRFIQTTPRFSSIQYQGVDINKHMIAQCHQDFGPSSHFQLGRKPQRKVDTAVFIGTFNLCHTDDYSLWEDYILDQIEMSWSFIGTAAVLNMTSLSHPLIRNHIFYAEPERMTQRLNARFGKTTATHTRFLTEDISFLITKR